MSDFSLFRKTTLARTKSFYNKKPKIDTELENLIIELKRDSSRSEQLKLFLEEKKQWTPKSGTSTSPSILERDLNIGMI